MPAPRKKSRWKVGVGRGVPLWRDGRMGLTARGFVRLTLPAVGLVAEKSDRRHCRLRCTDTPSWDVPGVSSGGDLGHINLTCLSSRGLKEKGNF